LFASIVITGGVLKVRKGRSVRIKGRGAKWAIHAAGWKKGGIFKCKGKLTLENIELHAPYIPSTWGQAHGAVSWHTHSNVFSSL
jgi:hypothetical protein